MLSSYFVLIRKPKLNLFFYLEIIFKNELFYCLPENKSKGKKIGPIKPTVESMLGVIIAKNVPIINHFRFLKIIITLFNSLK